MSNTDVTIQCPHCGESFQLTEALAKPFLDAERSKLHAEAHRFVEAERAKVAAKAKADAEAGYTQERQAMQQAAAERDRQIAAAKAAELAARKTVAEAAAAKQDVELTVARAVQAAREQIAKEATAKANEEAKAELDAMSLELFEKNSKLQEAQAAELKALHMKKEAEDAKREVELRVARELDAERTKVRDAAIKERDEEHRLQLAEKDKQIQAMNQQVEELRRKGTSGSQQLAGEVLELDLEAALRHAFPNDRFDPVPKGQNGADIVQTVISPTGVPSGKILWECKRTKSWNKAWLAKLRDDQRAVGANGAVIASETLPDEVTTFDCIDSVWVSALAVVIPLARVLRAGVIETTLARRAAAIDGSVRDEVFSYLTTPKFQQRVVQTVEAYGEMRKDLDIEKRSMVKQWGKREKQLDRMLGGISGLYGDLQGIVGSGLPAVPKLELPGLEHDGAEPQSPHIAPPQLPHSPSAGDAAGVN